MSWIGRIIAKHRRAKNLLYGLDEHDWIERVRKMSPLAVAVVEPEWRGVYSSMANLFPACLSVADALSPRSAQRVADLLLQTGATRFVFAEMPRTYLHLLAALERAGRKVNVYATWYNSFMMSSQRSWKSLVALKQLVAEGRIRKIGFAKTGMAEVFNRQGVAAAFIAHAINKVPAASSMPLAGGPHLGLTAVNLSVWRKLPYASLAATTQIPGAVVHVAGANSQISDFSRELGINAQIRQQPIPQHEMPAFLRSMHLNLYVTLSECCPMVPLESLAEGVPCLLGPNSHLFEDSEYLHSRLVVNYPERNEIIAHYISQALAERAEIIAAYRSWAPRNWQRCQESLANFLDAAGAAVSLSAAA